jgi:mRNA-degrading endonuclease toxin of MazEF toxin-antitoxin module
VESPSNKAKAGSAQGANLPAKQGTTTQNLPKEEQKSETLKVHPIKENAPLSVEETIRRVEVLQENIATRELLQHHLRKVSALKFGEYDEKDQLVLVDAKGQQYPIRSSGLCQECAALAKRRIEEHIAEVESQIIF